MGDTTEGQSSRGVKGVGDAIQGMQRVKAEDRLIAVSLAAPPRLLFGRHMFVWICVNSRRDGEIWLQTLRHVCSADAWIACVSGAHQLETMQKLVANAMQGDEKFLRISRSNQNFLRRCHPRRPRLLMNITFSPLLLTQPRARCAGLGGSARASTCAWRAALPTPATSW